MGKTNYSILAAGECAEYYSFVNPQKSYRTSDSKYNIEAGFYAAMFMLDKEVNFSYMPMTWIEMPESDIYYVGEWDVIYDEIIVDGNVDEGKFVVYLCKFDEIMGFMTFGFDRLHIYLLYAMKMLMMPSAMSMQ